MLCRITYCGINLGLKPAYEASVRKNITAGYAAAHCLGLVAAVKFVNLLQRQSV